MALKAHHFRGGASGRSKSGEVDHMSHLRAVDVIWSAATLGLEIS